MRVVVIIPALMLMGHFVAAAEPAGGVEPKTAPLKLTITGKKQYPLDLNGATPAEYREAIRKAGKGGGKVPPPPAVELTVVLTNTSRETITVWKTGDPVVLELTIAGEGAENIAPPLPFTREFRIPEPFDIKPGKSIEFTVEKLSSGFRGRSRFSYWTDLGDYTITAKLQTGMDPKPAGAQDFDGFGKVTVTSAPFAISVVAKK